MTQVPLTSVSTRQIEVKSTELSPAMDGIAQKTC